MAIMDRITSVSLLAKSLQIKLPMLLTLALVIAPMEHMPKMALVWPTVLRATMRTPSLIYVLLRAHLGCIMEAPRQTLVCNSAP